METIQIQLPNELAQRIRQEMPAHEALNRIVAEAMQFWLEKRREKKSDKEKALHALQQAGLIVSSERQRAMAEALLRTLSRRTTTTDLAGVRASLSKLKVPLSEEILAMRGEP